MMPVGVPRSLVLIVLDLLRKMVFQVVSLEVSLFDYSEDFVAEVTGIAAFYSGYDIETLLFYWRRLDLFFFVERCLTLAAVLPLSLPLSLDLASTVLKVKSPHSTLGL